MLGPTMPEMGEGDILILTQLGYDELALTISACTNVNHFNVVTKCQYLRGSLSLQKFKFAFHCAASANGGDVEEGRLNLVESYQQSTDFKQLKTNLDSIEKGKSNHDEGRKESSTSYSTNFFWQVCTHNSLYTFTHSVGSVNTIYCYWIFKSVNCRSNLVKC